MIPFELKRLDPKDNASIVERLLFHSKRFLNLDERTQEAASFLLARIITRPDVVHSNLEETISWALGVLSASDCKSFDV